RRCETGRRCMADDRLVEVVAVFLELKTGKSVTEEEIMHYCRQHLASFKVPRRVILVNDWPMTGAGKIQRFVLKEFLSARSDAWIGFGGDEIVLHQQILQFLSRRLASSRDRGRSALRIRWQSEAKSSSA